MREEIMTLNPTPDYPRGWVSVHCGLSKYVAPTIAEAVRKEFGDPTRSFIDGDGWNCWGEPPSTDLNDKHTRHVQFATPYIATAMDIRAHLEERYSDDLVPILTGDDSYIRTVISGSEDWASGNDLTTLLESHDWNLNEHWRRRHPEPSEVPGVNYKVKLGVEVYLLDRTATDPQNAVIADLVQRVSDALGGLSEPLTIGVKSHKIVPTDELPDWVIERNR
jgi:hypothetical protein